MKATTALALATASFAFNAAADLDSHFYHPDSQTYTNPADDGYAYENIRF